MERGNKDLAVLLGQGQRMEAMKIPKSTTIAKGYERIGHHSKSLYNILERSLTSSCGCSIPHSASLQLEARSHREPASIHEERSDLCFNVLFSFETDPTIPKPVLPWGWRETRIELINDKEMSPDHEHAFIETPQIQDATSVATAKRTTTSTLAMIAMPIFTLSVIPIY